MVVVSQVHQEDPEPVARQLPTIEDLARAQHAEPVAYPAELAADVWESDAELEAFLADLRASRQLLAGSRARSPGYGAARTRPRLEAVWPPASRSASWKATRAG
jgi:hypothetical protein